jgi:uncharacterized membrane protein YqaE (UPF0057 family)
MKKIFTTAALTFLSLLIACSSFAIPSLSVLPKSPNANLPWATQLKDAPEVKGLSADMVKMSIDQFLSLTPAKYKKLTGEKLGLKKSMELKAAQKLVKSKFAGDEGISKGLYIVLAILGLGWIALGILSGWSGKDWWLNLILTLLCWIPGVIHALVKMKSYYN